METIFIHCAQMAEIALKRTLKDYAVRRADRMAQMSGGVTEEAAARK